MVVVRAMRMAPWAVVELLAGAEVSKPVAALEFALVEVVVAALERIPVANVVVQVDSLRELLVLERRQLVVATMKKYQV